MCRHFFFALAIGVSVVPLRMVFGAGAVRVDHKAPQVVAPSYESEVLKRFDRTAREIIRGEDVNAAWDAMKLSYDLRRPDLLAAALGGRGSAIRLTALRYLEKLPLESQRKALVLSLGDHEVFPPPMENLKAEEDRVGTLAEYKSFAKSVCRRLGIRTSEELLNVEDNEARHRLSLRLLNTLSLE